MNMLGIRRLQICSPTCTLVLFECGCNGVHWRASGELQPNLLPYCPNAHDFNLELRRIAGTSPMREPWAGARPR